MTFGGRPRKRESHEKSMHTYVAHARQDAMAMATMLVEDETYTLSAIRKWYKGVTLERAMEFEERNAEHIAAFIEMTESRRPAFLRKISSGPNGDTTRLLFLVLAIIGANRAAEVLELRDRYASLLAPGRGNRMTAAGVYRFAHEVSGSCAYAWPFKTFYAIGEYDDD